MFFIFYFYLSTFSGALRKETGENKKQEWPTCDRAVETLQCSAPLVTWSLWAPSSILCSHKSTRDSLINLVSLGLFEEKKQDNISSVPTEFELFMQTFKNIGMLENTALERWFSRQGAATTILNFNSVLFFESLLRWIEASVFLTRR